MAEEVLADRHLGAVQDGHPALLPGHRIGLAARLTSAQDQQVGHHAGAGGALVCAARQPQRPGQVGQAGHLAASGRVPRVECVPGGQQHHKASRPGQVQGLDDEVVVDAVPRPVVPRVVQRGLPERDVADHQVEGRLREACPGEGAGDDCGARVERGGDSGGDRLNLDPGHVGAGRGKADEIPRPAARLQNPAAGEAELPGGRPDRPDQGGIGVVRVQRAARSGRQLLSAQRRAELLTGPGELPAALVEHLGHRAPARPPCQRPLLVGSRTTPFSLNATQRGQCGEVGANPADATRRRQVVLACGPECGYPFGRWPFPGLAEASGV